VAFLMAASLFTGAAGLACLSFAAVYLWRKLEA
jgi:hypothetical protein